MTGVIGNRIMIGRKHWWMWIFLFGGPALFAFVLGVVMPLFHNPQSHVSVGLSEAILEDTLRAVLDSDPNPRDPSSFRKTLRGELARDAKETKAKLPMAKEKWQSSGKTPQDYMEAALVIIKDIEQNEHRWLTLGNVIRVLGPPSLAVHLGYTFVESDNIDPEITRLDIHYENRKVSVSFSTAGFVNAVLYQERPEQWQGSGLPMHWPQKHSYAEKLPIISKTFEKPETVVSLMRASEGLIKKNPTESHWLKLMSESFRAMESDREKSHCSARIILTDGLFEDLAKVNFQMIGLHTLYCDTWWLLKEGGWQMIPHREAENILISRGQNPQSQE